MGGGGVCVREIFNNTEMDKAMLNRNCWKGERHSGGYLLTNKDLAE